jgi:6-phosphogluconolactonase (cycloisomerase 2 family)
LDSQTGELKLWGETGGYLNPAYMDSVAEHNIVYTVTETILANGEIIGFELEKDTGKMKEVCRQSAEGRSTCYITIHRSRSHLLLTNYWDSLLGVFPIATNGHVQPMVSKFAPLEGVAARTRADHLAHRQSEPHHHCLEFDPAHGRIAYVPDLGKDCVHQFVYGPKEEGGVPVLQLAGSMKTSMNETVRAGPRYICFHPTLPVAYIINELSSTVAVFEFDADAAAKLQPGDQTPTLKLVQESSTIPSDFTERNTCGRVAVDKTGKFVISSNRGHDSVSVHSIDQTNGTLTLVGIYSTQGKTPRHFNFDPSNQFVLVANQDTNNVVVFRMNQETGVLVPTGHQVSVNSPNYVFAL